MQNAIRLFPSYSTWDMFSNTVTYNIKIGVYTVQLLSQFLSCIQMRYYKWSSATHSRPPPYPKHTHTRTHTLSLLGSLSILICYYHTQLKVNIPLFGCTKQTNSHFCCYFLSLNCIPRGASTAPQGALLKFPMLHFIWLFWRRGQHGGLESDR